MIFKIKTACYYDDGGIIKQYPVLKEFNYNEQKRTIEINTIEDLIKLRTGTHSLIFDLDQILIYDDYIE